MVRDMDISILLVDGHADTAAGLARHLRRDARLELLGTTLSTEEAATFLPYLEPDVILVDSFGNADALAETCRRLKRVTGARLVALVASMTANAWQTIHTAGADHYLLKQLDSDWPGRELRSLAGTA